MKAIEDSTGESLKDLKELVVFSILRDSECHDCKKELSKGSFLVMERGHPLCLSCADLDHLTYLPRGDSALTRRAKKHSPLYAVVVRFSRSRGRYERQGILVSEDAIEQAEQECLADEERRAKRRERDTERRADYDRDLVVRMTDAILKLFPGCPPKEAQSIAEHAARRGSGRVGRTSAGQALDVDALTLAVIASIRHRHTRYDELLMRGHDRSDARESIRGDVDRVLEGWRVLCKPTC